MDMVIVAVLVACVLVVLLVIGLYERELRRMAHFLNKREKGSNERVAVEFATRGIREVASAVNSELDSLRDARLEQEKRQQGISPRSCLSVSRYSYSLGRRSGVFAAL